MKHASGRPCLRARLLGAMRPGGGWVDTLALFARVGAAGGNVRYLHDLERAGLVEHREGGDFGSLEWRRRRGP